MSLDLKSPLETQIDKRKFLSVVGRLIGVGVASSVVTMTGLNTALAYERRFEGEIKAGLLFNEQQMQVLAQVCQVILPKTDSPGGADLDCHGFIDHQLKAVFGRKEQVAAIALIDEIERLSIEHFASSFSQLSAEEQTSLLVDFELGKWTNSQQVREFKQLKQLTVFGYFTTKVGATQVLNYQPIPGGFKGSIPCTEETKNYGSLGFY